MNQFKLDTRLQNDCFQLDKLNNIHLLLMNNALIPWFILVPETDEIELCDLPEPQKQQAYKTIDELSLFVKSQFGIDKLNVAAIGNVVSQLHIHIVGRRKDDCCWPNVVWGMKEKKAYQSDQIENIINKLKTYFNESFITFEKI